MRWGILLLIMCTAPCFGLKAKADNPAAPAKEKKDDEAVQAFERGKYHFERSEFDEAAQAFRLADSLRPNWKIRYNLAQSEAAAKRYGLALEAFEAYLAGGGDEIAPARRDEVILEIERLRKIVGSVDVQAPDGAEIFVDGMLRGRAPMAGSVLLAAGTAHALVVKLEGEVLYDQKIKVNGEQERRIAVQAGAATSESEVEPETDPEQDEEIGSTPEPESPANGKSGMKTAGWVLTGLGGALLIGGAVTGGMALSKDGDLEAVCKNGCPPDKASESETVDRLALTTNVLLGVGAAAAVAGVVLVVIGTKKGKETPTVSLSPAFGETVAGATVTWRF